MEENGDTFRKSLLRHQLPPKFGHRLIAPIPACRVDASMPTADGVTS
jgi:hypothetical protein